MDGISMKKGWLTGLAALVVSTAILQAAKIGTLEEAFNACDTVAFRQLLEKGADPNRPFENHLPPHRPLYFTTYGHVHLSAGESCSDETYLQMSALLLEHGAKAEKISCEISGSKSTLLHCLSAYPYGLLPFMRLVAQSGIDIEAIDKAQKRAVDYIDPESDYWREKYTLLLRHGHKKESLGPSGEPAPLEQALKKGESDILEKMVEKSFDRALKPKSRGAGLEDLRFLSGYPSGKRAIEKFLKKADEKYFVRPLLASLERSGIDIEKIPNALHRAVWGGDPEAVEFLLQKGVDANTPMVPDRELSGFRYDRKETPLFFAMQDDVPNRYKIIEMLLRHGADPNRRNADDATPMAVGIMHKALDEKTVMEMFKRGAKTDFKSHGYNLLFLLAKAGMYEPFLFVEKKERYDLKEVGPRGTDLLMLAAASGNKELVSHLLNKGLDPSHADKSGLTALHTAASKGDANILKVLLEHGGDANRGDKRKKTPLMTLFDFSKGQVLESAITLLEHGADVKCVDKYKKSPLHYLVENYTKPDCGKIVKLLVEAGGDVNAADDNGRTPLHVSAYADTLYCMQGLLQHGADMSIGDKEGKTALMRAVDGNNVGSVALLMSKTENKPEKLKSLLEETFPGDMVKSFYQFKKEYDEKSEWKYLFNGPYYQWKDRMILAHILRGAPANSVDPSTGNTLLFIVDDTELLEYLVRRGADIHTKNKNGRSAVAYRFAESDRKWPLLEKMVELGAHENPKNGKGENLLDECLCDYRPHDTIVKVFAKERIGFDDINWALAYRIHGMPEEKFFEYVELLLQAGADAGTTDRSGRTIMDVATGEDGVPDDMGVSYMELFHRYGLSADTSDKRGLTPLHRAIFNDNDNAVQWLVKNGASPGKKDGAGLSPCDYERLFGMTMEGLVCEEKTQKTVSAALEEKYGRTPLHKAVATGDIEKVKNLLSGGADPNVKDTFGRTPLHYAAFKGEVEIAKILLKHGADLNVIEDSKGWTPLFFSSYAGHREFSDFLVEHGADSDILDKKGKKAEDYEKGK